MRCLQVSLAGRECGRGGEWAWMDDQKNSMQLLIKHASFHFTSNIVVTYLLIRENSHGERLGGQEWNDHQPHVQKKLAFFYSLPDIFSPHTQPQKSI